MTDTKTSEQILGIARELLASGGLGAVSFDSIAQRLGRSKQAVLYWFPTKHDLLAAMFLPWLEAEADVAANSVTGSTNRREAIDSFVHAIASFHFQDLDRFRMMYLVPQTIKRNSHDLPNARIAEQAHPVTDRIYSALAACLDGDSAATRKEAAVIHFSVLGVVLMFALADGLHDPLKHNEQELVEALIANLTTF